MASSPASQPASQADPAALELSPLSTLGQYQVIRLIGSGGMGMVYEGFHPRLRRKVAIKVVRPRSAGDRDALARFDRELAAIGRLAHPHIVQAFDAGDEDGRHFLVMELVAGCTAEQLSQQLGPLPIAEACEIVRQAADGLRHAHDQGLVHRDVKPSNLLISEQGQVKVADLGLARPIDEQALAQLTLAGDAIGTVDYMAPEQARGERNVSAAADVYALGCTFYRLLTGCVPFHSAEYDSLVKKLLAHVNDDPPTAQSLRPEIPADLAELLGAMMNKLPAQRPALKDAIERLAPAASSACLLPLVARVKAQLPNSPPAGAARISTISETVTYPGHPQVQSNEKRPVTRRLWIAVLLLAAGSILATAVAGYFALGGGTADSPGPAAALPEAHAPPPQDKVDNEVAAPPASPVVFEDLDSSTIQLERRYPLLNKPPLPLSWTVHPLAEQRYNPDLRQFRLSHPGFAMFALGRVSPAIYSLQFEMFQNRWSGGGGVFWGMQRMPEQSRETWQAQALHFKERRFGDGVRDFPLMLCRDKLTLSRNPDGSFDVQRSSLAGIPIPQPPNRVQTLTLRFGDAGLIEVRWAGDEVAFRPLCTFELNRQYQINDYAGQFGVYGEGCELIVDSASILVERWPASAN